MINIFTKIKDSHMIERLQTYVIQIKHLNSVFNFLKLTAETSEPLN